MADRTIIVPSPFMGGIDAILEVDSPDGETAHMTLSAAGEVLAAAGEFRRAEVGRWTWLDAPEGEIAGTFGAFLTAALEYEEGSEERSGWDILDDSRAGDYAISLYELEQQWQEGRDD
jgi:hypothetical protein